MKAEELMDLIGEADENIVEEAGQLKNTHRHHWTVWAAVAACIVLAGTAIAVTGNRLNGNQGTGIPAGTEEANRNQTETVHVSSGTEEATESQTENETESVQEPEKNREPAVLPGDRVVINRIRVNTDSNNYTWFDPNPNQFYMTNVTTMSFAELMTYYGLRTDLDMVLSDVISSFLNEEMTVEELSFYFFPWGVYRDGTFVYDVNTIGFRGKKTEEVPGRFRYITFTFAKDVNILFPGRKVLLEDDDATIMNPPGIAHRILECETSLISGQECTILQTESFVDGEWILYPDTYEVDATVHGVDVIIDIQGLSEQQTTDLLKKVFIKNWRDLE